MASLPTPIATFDIIPKGNQNAQIREFGPVTIPDEATRVACIITHDGATMPGIAWGLFLTLDGGTTWMPWGGAGTFGPQTSTTSHLLAELPPGTSRRVRGFLNMVGAAIIGLQASVY